jgi:hypothetical protein
MDMRFGHALVLSSLVDRGATSIPFTGLVCSAPEPAAGAAPPRIRSCGGPATSWTVSSPASWAP